MTKQEFIEKLAKAAKAVCKERGYGYAQYATCCAQGCCESGYGKSKIMMDNNAVFGIKATSAWLKADPSRKAFSAKTGEVYNGTYTTITAAFRSYSDSSLVESVRDYFDLLSNKRYRASLTANTVEECITIIKNGGYATSPTYIQTILNFYSSINVLIDNVWNGVYNNKEEDVKVYYPVLRRGCTGKNQAVKRLQKLLNKCGYGLAEDGIFGPLTDLAVRDYQSKNVDSNGAKLEVDGCVGPKTWSSLNKLEKGA